MQKLRNLTLGASAIVLALSSVATSLGAVATWSEEMTSLPDPNRWGTWDDAHGDPFGNPFIDFVQMATDPDSPSNTGVWKIPRETPSGLFSGYADFGMAVIRREGSTIVPDPPHASWPRFTYEARYRVNTTLNDDQLEISYPEPEGRYGDFEAKPFTIDVDSPNHPAVRFADGYDSLSGGEGNFVVVHTNDGLGGGGVFKAPKTVVPAKDTWHRVRIAQEFVTGGTKLQRVWLDDELIEEAMLNTVTGVGFSRSITIRRSGQGDPFLSLPNNDGPADFPLDDFLSQEIMLDYIRMTDRVLDINEALLAPGGVTFDAADFDENGSVGTADYNAWATNFGLASGATKAQGDADGDGNVDGGDFLKWQEQYGLGGGSFAAVPEPATALSVALMVGALVTRRRRA